MRVRPPSANLKTEADVEEYLRELDGDDLVLLAEETFETSVEVLVKQ